MPKRSIQGSEPLHSPAKKPRRDSGSTEPRSCTPQSGSERRDSQRKPRKRLLAAKTPFSETEKDNEVEGFAKTIELARHHLYRNAISTAVSACDSSNSPDSCASTDSDLPCTPQDLPTPPCSIAGDPVPKKIVDWTCQKMLDQVLAVTEGEREMLSSMATESGDFSFMHPIVVVGRRVRSQGKEKWFRRPQRPEKGVGGAEGPPQSFVGYAIRIHADEEEDGVEVENRDQNGEDGDDFEAESRDNDLDKPESSGRCTAYDCDTPEWRSFNSEDRGIEKMLAQEELVLADWLLLEPE